jgi:transposase
MDSWQRCQITLFSAKKKAAQCEFWIAADQVVTSTKGGFCAKLDETLESFEFAGQVRALCAPAHDKSGVGRPGIDPVVYLKMLMVGFFEDWPSERAIAARGADSIAIRQFLHYELTEATPDHSSLSIIRQRWDGPIYEQVFTLVLSALQEHGLLRGKHVGIDSSVMEANASLRGLVNRSAGEAYWEYVKRLAAQSGIDPQDSAAVRKFDRKRTKKMSNQEWENPQDLDAKIGPKKDGATDMIYKPQTVVDLDAGALVGAEVRPGDQADHHAAATAIWEAQENIKAARDEDRNELTVQTATADKGYYEVGQRQALQQEQIKTVICDPIDHRRLDKLGPAERRAVRAAGRSTSSKYGRALLRKRGQHIERAFAHILDCGGMRRATLRGLQNLQKRFKLAAAFYNLSQLMRRLFGMGTPKQCAAMGRGAVVAFLTHLVLSLLALAIDLLKTTKQNEPDQPFGLLCPLKITA